MMASADQRGGGVSHGNDVSTPLPKGDSRRKTAKEIAQMYEQLKNKYIERKRDWQIERAELLKKLGLANESQQLLGNMKTICEGFESSSRNQVFEIKFLKSSFLKFTQHST